MAEGSMSIDKEVVIQFNKIRLVNGIADAITDYGMQCGFSNLGELVDLNCGAIPEGDINQVIDFSAPDQFLSLYTHIAEARLAFSVTQVLKISDKCWQPILDFCYKVGRDNQINEVKTALDAFHVYQLFVLDGMPGVNSFQVINQDEEKIAWKKTVDTHEEYWNKFNGDVNNYYEILKFFVAGLLENTGISFTLENNSDFSLDKIVKTEFIGKL